MSNKAIVIVIDGCAHEYLEQGVTQNISELGKKGFFKNVKSALPSVTNVNHATILTGSLPIEHQVTGNYFYNPESEEQGFIDGKGFLNKETILDAYAKQGKSTALLVVKGKVLQVFGDNVEFGLSTEHPDENLVKHLDMEMPPYVATPEANGWIMEACYNLIRKDNPDFIYCTTNDYTMHNYNPNHEIARKQMESIDYWIGEIYKLDPEREIYITADHGMTTKTLLIDLQKKMNKTSFDTVCMLPLKDRYLENHIYQEGCAVYVYAKDQSQKDDIYNHLQSYSFIESIYTREEAMDQLGLPGNRIGDLVIFGTQEVAFGELEDEELAVTVRTHGSKFEQDIPLIAVNARREASKYERHFDIVRYMFEDLKVSVD
ncbi:alkaline phosphatase family protein [Bacillus massiliigorillae]|uniref:alkaline phosphatase family protein n=1 Tax=Bacillus massiliigorillae TaxID=1243664 RepID=UPI00039B1350|nr:alkaline phosphatase family protein [Bacillus massiliigorillae]